MRKYIVLLCLFLPILVSAKTIKGTIVSEEDKQPMIGASVFVEPADLRKISGAPAAVGVITDIDGHFVIDVPDAVTRIFCSYIGYETTEVRLNQKANHVYQIRMRGVENELTGVVVTGYQRIEKRKLTAAVSKLEINDDMVGTARSIDQALAGQVAGVAVTQSSGAPGQAPKIRIRGTSSLNGTQDPLWVLDGIPLEGTDVPSLDDLKDITEMSSSSIAGLNPADIENITILKDAAATAIYGARAANGVIVVTTKQGKAGASKVTFSTKLTFLPRLNLSSLNLLNSDEKVALELDLLGSDYTYRQEKGAVAQLLASYNMTEVYKQGGWGAISQDAQQAINALRQINTDWADELYQNAFNQEYNISVSGGNDKAKYYTSLGFYDEKGSVIGVDANRLNIVLKADYQLNKRLRAGASVFATRRQNKSFLTDNDGFTSPSYYSRRANPYQLIYDSSQNYVYDTNVQSNQDTDLDFNIAEERANTSYEQQVYSLMNNFDIEYKLTPQLRLTSQVGLQADFTNTEKIADHNSYAMRKDKMRARFIDAEGNYYSALPEGGYHKETDSRSTQVTWKSQAEYRTQFLEAHELEVMAGFEMRRTWYRSLFSAGYGFNRQTLTTKPVNFPNENQASYFPLHQLVERENAYVSQYATGSYTLLHRYTLGASLRFDGSDLFGVSKKYRYLPLYSFSGLWRLKGEEWLSDVEWIDNLAVRASYGLQGNIDKNTSPYVLGKYATGSILPGYSEDIISILAPPNEKLRWEKTASYNAGLDWAVFNSAITLSLDYYYRKGTDLIAMQQLPLESGFTSTSVNWASMKNEGVELTLMTRNITGRRFSWQTTLNVGYNTNKVLSEGIPSQQTTPSREGYSVGAIFAYRYAGTDDSGYPLFYNKAGEKVTAKEFFNLKYTGVDVATQLTVEQQRELYTYVGSTEPKVSGGFINTFSFDNFDLTINCNFNLGHYVRCTPSYSLTDYDRGMNTNRDILSRWTPTSPNAEFPKLLTAADGRIEEYTGFRNYHYENYFDYWVRKGDYMRVQSITLGYRFPASWNQFLRISSGRMSLEGRNLFVVGADYHNYLDPETMGNQFATPIPKQISFSLNLSF